MPEGGPLQPIGSLSGSPRTPTPRESPHSPPEAERLPLVPSRDQAVTAPPPSAGRPQDGAPRRRPTPTTAASDPVALPALVPSANTAAPGDERAAALNQLVDPVSGDQQPIQLKRTDMIRGLGMDAQIYDALARVAREHDCLIFIRATDGGILEGMAPGGRITGKTLATRGRSSHYQPIRANIAFCASLSRSLVADRAATERPGAAPEARSLFAQRVAAEQDKLLKALEERLRPTFRLAPDGFQHPTFCYIPKLLPEHRVVESYLPPDRPAPAWVHLKIDSAYTAEVSYPPALGWPPLTLNAAGDLVDRPPTVQPQAPMQEYLWVRRAPWAECNAAFQARLRHLPGEWAQFEAELAPSQGTTGESEPFYELYFHEEQALGTNYPAGYWEAAPEARFLGHGAGEWLDTFAPLITNPPAALAPGRWRQMAVLAQARLSGPKIAYHEIVADFDIFCICPSIASIEAQLAAPGADWKAIMGRYAPRVPSRIKQGIAEGNLERGVLSVFEEELRTAMNLALITCGAADGEGAAPGAERAPSRSVASEAEIDPTPAGPRFVLHGCEVNNYFHTETLDRLIFIRPDGWESNRRITFLAENFINMADRSLIREPALNISTPLGVGQVAAVRFDKPKLSDHFLFQLNLQWSEAHRAAPSAGPGRLPAPPPLPWKPITERLEAIVLSGWKEIQDASATHHLPRTIPKSPQIVQGTGRIILRLAFYAISYHSLYLSLIKVHPPAPDAGVDEMVRQRLDTISRGFAIIRGAAATVRVRLNTFTILGTDQERQHLIGLNQRLGIMDGSSPRMPPAPVTELLDTELQALQQAYPVAPSPSTTAALYELLDRACFSRDYRAGLQQRHFLELVYAEIVRMEQEMQPPS